MRVDVKKFLFVGFKEDREPFFKKAQDLGIIHFIKSSKAKIKQIPEDIENVAKAIKVVKGLPPTEQEEIDVYSLADGIVQKILHLKQVEEKLAEEERIVRLEMERVHVFGDFSIEDIAYIEKETKRKVQYFFAKVGFADLSTLPPELLFVGSDHALDYFMALNPEPRQYPKMVEIHIERPYGTLKKRLQEIHEENHNAEMRLKTYAKYNKFLHDALINKLNSFHLNDAQKNVNHEMDGSLFAVEGWVPLNKIQELKPLVESMNVHVEEIAIESKDSIPTYLENEGASRLGEDLINIYDTPSHTDKDPSLWVLVFFAFFFAFIVGDGGYGLLFLGAALYVRYKYTLDSTWQRVMNLLIVLSAAVLIWGVLTTSFFGIQIGMDSPLRKISLIQWLVEKKAAYIINHHDEDWKYWVAKFPQLANVKDPATFLKEGATHHEGKADYVIYNRFADNIMFELAILIGVVHIILSMLRYIKRNWVNVGWIIFIIGCYLYLPHYLHVPSIIHFVFGVNPVTAPQAGFYMIIGGVGLATIFAIAQHRFAGILEPMAVGQIFADSMSYLRLYALGLSGAMLSATVNDLASGMNIVFGIIVLVGGHIVNMVLSIMGGTIHGLRLNFLEWYHYSFEGGGKPFDPLRKLKIE